LEARRLAAPKRVRETRTLRSGRAAPIPSLLPRCYPPDIALFRLAFLPVLSSPSFRLHCGLTVDATVFRPFLTPFLVARFDHSDGNKLFEFEAHIVAFEARGASPTPLSCRRSGVDPPAGNKYRQLLDKVTVVLYLFWEPPSRRRRLKVPFHRSRSAWRRLRPVGSGAARGGAPGRGAEKTNCPESRRQPVDSSR